MKALITECFGLGRVPVAPGTAASAAAIVIAFLLHIAGGVIPVILATALSILAGFLCITEIEDDPPHVVIDEVAGQLIAVLPVSITAGTMPVAAQATLWVAAFLLFRLFDIWKPGLIGRAERAGGAAGIMLDDVLAGALSAVILLSIIAGTALIR
ncbi:MAG: phosphatidylglycerophosphatase A [Rhodobacteraceae bacterium]|nr:phosphatidylglycerophosphatase A [Paracoccaceae bacterium]